MKATDLMIGDIVYTRDSNAINYIRIIAIDNTTNFIRGAYLNDNTDTGWFSCDLIKPIFSTIMKANGFERMGSISNNKEYNILIHHISESKMFLNCVSNSGVPAMIPFTYIHELQHALRLCGLNDLADNFKLKYTYLTYLT